MNVSTILSVVAERRAEHPELAHPLGWHGLQRILAREGIQVRMAPLSQPAMLVQYCGEWTIVLNVDLPTRRHMWAIVHELGHLWLHHDRACARGDRVYQLTDVPGPDAQEDDAEVFAACLLGGPRWF